LIPAVVVKQAWSIIRHFRIFSAALKTVHQGGQALRKTKGRYYEDPGVSDFKGYRSESGERNTLHSRLETNAENLLN
jgi:hypothetical protein